MTFCYPKYYIKISTSLIRWFRLVAHQKEMMVSYDMDMCYMRHKLSYHRDNKGEYPLFLGDNKSISMHIYFVLHRKSYTILFFTQRKAPYSKVKQLFILYLIRLNFFLLIKT